MSADEMRDKAETVYMRSRYAEDLFMFCSYPDSSWSKAYVANFRTYSPDFVFAGRIKVSSSFSEINSLFGDFGSWNGEQDTLYVNEGSTEAKFI